MTAFKDMNKLSPALIEHDGWFHFHCPGCNRPHTINTRTENKAPAWWWNGSGDKPTFTPSILTRYRHPKGHSNDNPAPADWAGEYVEDICHSFVTEGRIEFLNDCTHALVGQTVPIPDWPWPDLED